MTKFSPYRDRVLVERSKPKEQTETGLVIPDQAKEPPLEGTVIATGGGRLDYEGKLIPMVTKVGDRVLFAKYAGNAIHLDGKEFLILREDDLFGAVMEGGGDG